MRFIDPHIHMSARTTDDYERMAAAGIVALIEPAFWLGQPRTQVGSYIDYMSSLVGWERFRAAQFGIHHYCTIGLNSNTLVSRTSITFTDSLVSISSLSSRLTSLLPWRFSSKQMKIV